MCDKGKISRKSQEENVGGRYNRVRKEEEILDGISVVQRTVDYIEEHLTEPIDYDDMAAHIYCSVYHFQRMFHALTGYTLGEYIRFRRLSMAGRELQNTQTGILQLALKYGYDSPESFSRAFRKFHGVNPSVVRKTKAALNDFGKLRIYSTGKDREKMNYQMIQAEEMHFIGYKTHFSGIPSERSQQEEDFFVYTRLQQFALNGLVKDCETVYTLVTNVDDTGYDFYIAQQFAHEGCWLTQERYQNLAKLNPPLRDMFEEIVIPPRLYAVFQTQRSVYPTEQEEELRKSILLEWLPGSEFELEEGIEITKMQWKMGEKRNQRYLELWMPVKRR